MREYNALGCVVYLYWIYLDEHGLVLWWMMNDRGVPRTRFLMCLCIICCCCCCLFTLVVVAVVVVAIVVLYIRCVIGCVQILWAMDVF